MRKGRKRYQNKRVNDSNTILNSQSQEIPESEAHTRLTMDTFQNMLARIGYGTPSMLEATQYPNTRLTKDYMLMNSLYRSHWVIRRVIDVIPEDMCKNWYKITSQIAPNLIDKLEKSERMNSIKRKVLEGLKWGRLYGGAAGIIMIKGQEDVLNQPLDYDSIMPGSFKGLLIVDRWSGISPGPELVTDMNDPEFGLPDKYLITSEVIKGSVQVDHSRVVRFMGCELPFWEKQSEMYWGASEVEHVFDELKKRDNTSWNIANLVFRANINTIKMDGMQQMLATGNSKVQERIYNTIRAQNSLMNNFSMLLLDKNSEHDTKQYTFSGLSDIYQNFMLDVSGAAEIPVTKLFGRSPAGLNSTGESDLQNYYDTIEEKQEAYLRPAIDKLLPIECMSEFGAIPDDLDYRFNPIRRPTDSEKSDLGSKNTDSVIKAFDDGLISQKLALKELQQQSDLTGLWTNITDSDIENADDEISNVGEAASSNDGNLSNFNDPLVTLPTTDGGNGSGNFGHGGRSGEIGGSGEGGGSGSEAEKDCKLKNSSKEIQEIYDKNRKNEKVITPVMNDIAKALGAKMYGLEYSIKTASSVEDKIERKKEDGFSEKEAIESMGDIVRYTQLCPHNKIAENTIRTIEMLTKKGYNIIEIDNKYLDKNSDYKGVHINAISPEGQKFELQIHSKESMDVKNKIHPMYEEARNVKTSTSRKIELKKKMKDVSSKLPQPKGIETVKNFKKR